MPARTVQLALIRRGHVASACHPKKGLIVSRCEIVALRGSMKKLRRPTSLRRASERSIDQVYRRAWLWFKFAEDFPGKLIIISPRQSPDAASGGHVYPRVHPRLEHGQFSQVRYPTRFLHVPGDSRRAIILCRCTMSAKHPRLPNYALCSPEQAKQYAELTRQGLWGLLSYEIFWRDRYFFLENRGYTLRPRFKPDWTPSWLGTNRDPDFCEDSIRSVVRIHDHLRDSLSQPLF